MDEYLLFEYLLFNIHFSPHASQVKGQITSILHKYKNPGENLLLARYHASTATGFLSLAEYWCNNGIGTGIVLARLLMITWVGVGNQY